MKFERPIDVVEVSKELFDKIADDIRELSPQEAWAVLFYLGQALDEEKFNAGWNMYLGLDSEIATAKVRRWELGDKVVIREMRDSDYDQEGKE